MPVSFDQRHSRRFFAGAYTGAVLAVELVLVVVSPSFVNSLGLWWFATPLWILFAAPLLWLGRQRRLTGTVVVSAVLATATAFCVPYVLFILLIIFVVVQR
jgi:hypothetical protein